MALGMSFGIFAGMMPIMPFQTALAVALALFFKTSKITAAIGTWVSNPLNWYFQYYYTYKIGALILGLPEKGRIFSSIMNSVQKGEEALSIIGKIIGAGSSMIGAFIIGGVIFGIVFSIPAYFIFLKLFQWLRQWRRKRRLRRY